MHSFDPAGGVIDVIAAAGGNKKQGEFYAGDCGGGAGYGCYHGAQQKTKGTLPIVRTVSQCVCRQNCTAPAMPTPSTNQAAIDAAKAKADQAQRDLDASGCLQDPTRAGCAALHKAAEDAKKDVAKAIDQAAIDAAQAKADQAKRDLAAAGCLQDAARAGCAALSKAVQDAEKEVAVATETANANAGATNTTTATGGQDDAGSSSSSSSSVAGIVVGVLVAVCVIVGAIVGAILYSRSRGETTGGKFATMHNPAYERNLERRPSQKVNKLAKASTVTSLAALSLHASVQA